MANVKVMKNEQLLFCYLPSKLRMKKSQKLGDLVQD